MKKQVKFLAVLSTAAMMAAVTPGLLSSIPGSDHTALAASKAGWTEEDGELRYRDSDGYYLTDTWKKKTMTGITWMKTALLPAPPW